MQPINVLHVMTKLPLGGVENQLLLVLQHYDKTKISPIVCSLSDMGEIGKKIQDMGVEVIPLNKLKHNLSLSIIYDLYKLIRQRNIHVVRTHQYHANLYGRIAAYLAGTPCIIPSIHNLYTRDRKIHRRIFNNLLAKISHRIIAVSEAVKRDIVRYDKISPDKIQVIYNGIEEKRFLTSGIKCIRKELNIPEKAIIVGTIGRLVAQKGHKYLIEAVSILKEKIPNLYLMIVGDGVERTELLTLVSKKGLQKRTIFTGSRNDIPDLLSAMNIFVFPSLWEGLPNALIEAMASGKPIIASDIPPVREVLHSEKYGKFVPPASSEAIASAIELLINNEKLQTIGKAAKQRALTRFSIKNTVNSYTNLFEEILRTKEN